ncbi:MAG: hypothetical protein SGPRY_008369, partial [Prymnesium sp.]
VDRRALKAELVRQVNEAEGTTVVEASLLASRIAPNIFDANLQHDATGSDLTLSNGQSVRATIVVDATGFESKMVARESDATAGLWKPLGPGYQIAYGFACELEEGHAPYDEGAMTLFDYRTDHFEKLAEGGGEQERAWLEDAEARPSFMYVMPQGLSESGRARAFFEETSLVGRDERRLEFAELKRRAELRLSHLGIKVVAGSVEEEEFCYIPMGGSLPDASQRIVPVGGAAATVHPATGYQLCRMLASTTDRVVNLRGFFDAFFQLEEEVWGGFLAGWSGLPGNSNHESWDKRLQFGLTLAVRFPPQVFLSLIGYAILFSIEFGPTLLRSFVSPLFGKLEAYDAEESLRETRRVYVDGDLGAKAEVAPMMKQTSKEAEKEVASV